MVYTQQPGHYVPVDLANPLIATGNSLRPTFYYAGAFGFDAGSGLPANFTHTAAALSESFVTQSPVLGTALSLVSNLNDGWNLSPVSGFGTRLCPYLVATKLVVHNISNTYYLHNIISTSTGFGIYCGTDGTTLNLGGQDAGYGTVSGSMPFPGYGVQLDIVCMISSGGVITFWVNDTKVVLTSNLYPPYVVYDAELGRDRYSGGGSSVDVEYFLSIPYKLWSDSDVANFRSNPWQILRPRQRNLYMAGGGGLPTQTYNPTSSISAGWAAILASFKHS